MIRFLKNKDFTQSTFSILLSALQEAGFNFMTFSEYLLSPASKTVILRHDVDKDPLNSLEFAFMEKNLNIYGTYYFRILPGSFDPDIISKILSLGHEIGYHYEDINLVAKQVSGRITEKKLADYAEISFRENLAKLRKLAPVKTICMHGSPLGRFDNRIIWNYYNYKDYGLIGEPYFDLDFNKVLYITDTGRQWNGSQVSLRDKTDSGNFHKQKFRSTFDIINAAKKGSLTKDIMLTTHPQRWNNRTIPWLKELLLQRMKNSVKALLVHFRGSGSYYS